VRTNGSLTLQSIGRATRADDNLAEKHSLFEVPIIDDPMKPQDAMSEATRESTKQWYANTLLSRLDNKTQDAIVMQRLHVDDLVGHLLEGDGWDHLNLPAIAEYDETLQLGPSRYHRRRAGDVLHPTHEPLSVLDEFKRSMGSMAFAAQYLQEPVPEGGNLIKWSWFRFYDNPPTRETNDRILVSWDTALSAKELASFSACVVLQIRGGSIFVLDVIRERLEYPDLKRKVIHLHKLWRRVTNDYSLLIENKGSGMSLIQDLRDQNIHATAINPVGEKTMRMYPQTACIEEGSVYLPTKAPWLNEFHRELMAFPAGRHSDQVDALSQALFHAFDRTGGEFSWKPVRGMY
jgi:predicted phage terminase large subunit-like protein